MGDYLSRLISIPGTDKTVAFVEEVGILLFTAHNCDLPIMALHTEWVESNNRYDPIGE